MNLKPSAAAFAVGLVSVAYVPLLHAQSADGASAGSQTKSLAGITVTAGRPSSLPGYIPTNKEGVTAEEIAENINAKDAQEALKKFPSLLVRKR